MTLTLYGKAHSYRSGIVYSALLLATSTETALSDVAAFASCFLFHKMNPTAAPKRIGMQTPIAMPALVIPSSSSSVS